MLQTPPTCGAEENKAAKEENLLLQSVSRVLFLACSHRAPLPCDSHLHQLQNGVSSRLSFPSSAQNLPQFSEATKIPVSMQRNLIFPPFFFFRSSICSRIPSNSPSDAGHWFEADRLFRQVLFWYVRLHSSVEGDSSYQCAFDSPFLEGVSG
ncbi:hypothetical protein ACLOJK_009445 [Asimina triloba]